MVGGNDETANWELVLQIGAAEQLNLASSHELLRQGLAVCEVARRLGYSSLPILLT